jgi:CheY-like chemotaxis protein
MNSIIGFTDLVLTSEIGKTQREYMQNVSRSSYNLLNIINDILDFSKIEAGKLSIDETSFNLVELVEETVDLLAIKAQEKSLEIVCQIDPTIAVQFMGDASRIRQILVNLIGNAIKFTDKGEVIVTVSQSIQKIKQQSTRIRNVTISVKDTGIGIAAEKVQSIFESFTQADSSTTRKFGGTGLGLTISKRLAELMKGNITVSSKPGAGSEFSLNVPLVIVKEAPGLSIVPKGSLNKVLVVDDNITNCQLMQGIFEYLNISCTVCFSGSEALKLIRQSITDGRFYDLIITDHQMPEMDGITLVHEIKKILDDSVIPFILMLSSLEKSMFHDEAKKIGIDKFLSKPVKLNELTGLLSFVFEKPETRKDRDEPIPKISKFSCSAQILVAEDHLMNMVLIKEVLTNMGLEVIQAANGQEVLELLKDYEPALIFMDINMPVLDGFETTKRIRALNNSRKDIPIVALTADAMKEDKERCRQAGMNDYVSKPFRLKEIEAVLKTWIPLELQGKIFRA